MKNLRQMLCILALLLSAVGAKAANDIKSSMITITDHLKAGGYIEVKFPHYDDNGVDEGLMINKDKTTPSYIEINGTKVVTMYAFASYNTPQNEDSWYWCRYYDLGSEVATAIEFMDADGEYRNLPREEWRVANIKLDKGAHATYSTLRIYPTTDELAKDQIDVVAYLEYDKTGQPSFSFTKTATIESGLTGFKIKASDITFTDKLNDEGYVEVKFPHYNDDFKAHNGYHDGLAAGGKSYIAINGMPVVRMQSFNDDGTPQSHTYSGYWCKYMDVGGLDLAWIKYKNEDNGSYYIVPTNNWCSTKIKTKNQTSISTLRIYPSGAELVKGELNVDVMLVAARGYNGDYAVRKTEKFTFSPNLSSITGFTASLSKEKPGKMKYSFKCGKAGETFYYIDPASNERIDVTVPSDNYVISGECNISNEERYLTLYRDISLPQFHNVLKLDLPIPSYSYPKKLSVAREGEKSVKLSWDVSWSGKNILDPQRINRGNWILQRALNGDFSDAVTIAKVSDVERFNETVTFTFTDTFQDLEIDLDDVLAIFYRLRKDNNEWGWSEGVSFSNTFVGMNATEIVVIPGKLNAICRSTNGTLSGIGLKLYTFEGIYGEEFYGTPVEGNYIEAGKPYVFEISSDVLGFAPDKANFANETDGKWFAYNGLHGVLADNCDKGENFRTVSGSDFLVFTKDGTQRPAEGGTRVELGYCYLVFSEAEMPDLSAMPANARRIARRDGGTTGISPTRPSPIGREMTECSTSLDSLSMRTTRAS